MLINCTLCKFSKTILQNVFDSIKYSLQKYTVFTILLSIRINKKKNAIYIILIRYLLIIIDRNAKVFFFFFIETSCKK